MKLSELVKLKNELEQYAVIDNIEKEVHVVKDAISSITVNDDKYKEQFAELSLLYSQQMYLLQKTVEAKRRLIVEMILSDIKENSLPYYQKSYREFMATVEKDRTVRTLPVPDDINNIIIGRINQYTDWHYPGMEIGPHDGQYTKYLVGCDPLYLVDVHHEYLDSAASQFPIEYQARLRKYYIGFMCNERGLVDLPQNEFGFIFSWNFFNYLPLEEIKKYLADIVNVLRPGGTFMFSYNDGDSFNGAKHVEWGGMVYTPKSALVPLIESFGLTVTQSYGFETTWHNISWLEVRKPGELSTIKAHQTMGLIRDIEQ